MTDLRCETWRDNDLPFQGKWMDSRSWEERSILPWEEVFGLRMKIHADDNLSAYCCQAAVSRARRWAEQNLHPQMSAGASWKSQCFGMFPDKSSLDLTNWSIRAREDIWKRTMSHPPALMDLCKPFSFLQTSNPKCHWSSFTLKTGEMDWKKETRRRQKGQPSGSKRDIRTVVKCVI